MAKERFINLPIIKQIRTRILERNIRREFQQNLSEVLSELPPINELESIEELQELLRQGLVKRGMSVDNVNLHKEVYRCKWCNSRFDTPEETKKHLEVCHPSKAR